MLNSAQYIASRARDFMSLSYEIKDTNGALGYTTIITPIKIVDEGKILTFKTPEDTQAFILKKYW